MATPVDFQEAKGTLIEAWGTLGSSWGINKAMAKIHILLLISPEPLSTEDIMEELNTLVTGWISLFLLSIATILTNSHISLIG